MAKQIVETLIDDLDKGPADETVTFGLDGKQYEIDLSDAHATALRENLADFVAVARLTRLPGSASPARSSARARTPGDRAQLAAIRAWAKQNGHVVSDRGRVSKAVLDAFAAAH